jgi:hypothetical protein
MAMLKIVWAAKSVFDWATELASRLVSAMLSNRGLAVTALVACAVLTIAPWMRPAISRDFRAIHIPWSGALSSKFLPEYVAEVPRPWRWDSVAAPILAVTAVGIVAVLLRPGRTRVVFGLLLALSIPAVSAAFWNHPALVEFLDGEVRQRAMIRAVIRQHADDMLSGGAPDRLSILGGDNGSIEEFETVHPVWHPYRYSVYGTWLIGLALIGTLVAQNERWPQRLKYAGGWALIGIGFAAAVTWPRWVSEYHWARAEGYEDANQFQAAEASLESAKAAMPQWEFTRRYWQTRGRLAYRQHQQGDFVAFFSASQHMLQMKPDLARAELEPIMQATGGTSVQRDLLGEIIGRLACRYIASGDQSASEVAWGEASRVAPWQPAYWIAGTAALLAADPKRAREMEDQLLPRLKQIGDRMVSSDFSSLIADAYFVTGDLERARDMYDRSMDTFDLPKYVNLHAQKGLLGM